ncbi:MAG: hypothetical protein OKBPIBMD_01721 [Chlorobi bacterium]|nr:MAG: hypothetical protein F9K28_04895 [Bacteroidota bacterium]MBV6464267.1 hypothetical protein [Chlorobiota bacterium]MBZ0194171.1 hypothetical protein [Candidatus Kapabacteria bacterium]WKZ77325.1 MAG: hypothetical protein QY319_09280 [Candidatus Kapabacteria bacterium]
MKIFDEHEAKLKKLGLEVFTAVDQLYMDEKGDEEWGYNYRNMLRLFLHDRPQLFLEVIAMLEMCISDCAQHPNILKIAADTMAFSGVQPEYAERTPLEFLQWVLAEMKDEWEHPSYDPQFPFGK